MIDNTIAPHNFTIMHFLSYWNNSPCIEHALSLGMKYQKDSF